MNYNRNFCIYVIYGDINVFRDLSEINGGGGGGGGNIELKAGNEVTHLSNRNEISSPSPWA